MKKILVFAIIMAMCVTFLAACGQTEQEKQGNPSSALSTSTGQQTDKTKTAEPVKITWFWNEGGVQLPEDSYVCKKILEDTNIQYVPINPKGTDYEQQLQLLLASGDVPDIITSYRALTVNLQKWGVIQPIEKYLTQEYIPNVIRIQNNWDYAIETEKWKDGHIWAMPNTNQSLVQAVPFIRYDWLNNLGLQVPATLEELSVVLDKFTKGDPDKNGKNDTVGMMANEYWGMLDFAFEMAASPGDLYKDENGNAVMGMFLPRQKDFLKYVRNLIAIGAMDPETATTKYDQLTEKVKASKVGFVWNWSERAWNEDIKKVDPNADWRPMPPPKGAYDKGYLWGGLLEREQYVVSSKTKNIKAIFELMNYMADDKSTAEKYDYSGTYWTSRYGERDVNWKVDDNGLFVSVRDPKIAAQNKIDNWTGICGRIQNKFDFAGTLTLPEDRLKALRDADSYPISYNIPADDQLKSIDISAWIPDDAFSAFSQEWMNNKWSILYYKAILGKVDIDKGWNDFVAEAKKVGLDQIISDTTKALKNDGILK